MRGPRVAFGVLLVVLLVPAAALSLARLTSPAFATGVQAVAFTPYALVPYTLALLLVLAAAVRRSRSWRLALPAVVAALGLGAHAVWAAPLVVGSSRTPARDTEPLTVMSSNLYLGRGDGGAVVLAAARLGVDVLVLSEVTGRTVAQMERAGIAAVLPYRAGEAGIANEGTMVFSAAPLVEVESVPGTTFDNLLVRTGGIDLLAAHPAAPLSLQEWDRDHGLLREAAARRGVDVIAGDLNATSDHAPLRALGDDGYRGAAELLDAGLQPTWPANGLYAPLALAPPLVRIDHVLLAPGWTATRTATRDIPGTDHLAVLAAVVPATGAIG